MRARVIRNFTKIKLNRGEMREIFIPLDRSVCRTCHKVRIKRRIFRDDFDDEHKNFICFCDIHQQNGQNFNNNITPNNNNEHLNNNNENNQIDNHNADMDDQELSNVVDNRQNNQNNNANINQNQNNQDHQNNNNVNINENQNNQDHQNNNNVNINQNHNDIIPLNNIFVTRLEFNQFRQEIRQEIQLIQNNQNNSRQQIDDMQNNIIHLQNEVQILRNKLNGTRNEINLGFKSLGQRIDSLNRH